jgi:hypothetical protein
MLKISVVAAVLRSRGRKESHYLVGAGAVARCGSSAARLRL